MNVKYIVYVTVNLCNGKLYFGVHQTDPKLFDGYIGNGIRKSTGAITNVTFHKAVRKYGYNNFKRIILAIFPNTEKGKKQAYDMERLIVNPISIKNPYIYNECIGGRGGANDLQKKRVFKFSLTGNYLRSYKCSRDAAVSLNLPENIEKLRTGIKGCCLGSTYSYKGFYWSYEKEFIAKEDFIPQAKRRYRPIAQYDVDGKFIAHYNNLKEAREATGISNINYAINSKGSVGGYQFRWYENSDDNIEPLHTIITDFRQWPILMIDKHGNTTEYSSIKECLENNKKLSAKGIKNVLRGVHKTHFSYIFKWKK